MKDMSAVAAGAAHVPVSDSEGRVDELPDSRVPAQEDELPQGVLDLLAVLSVRQQGSDFRGPAGRLREQARSHGELHSTGLDQRGLVERLREQARSHGELHSTGLDRRGLVERLREQAHSHKETPSNVRVQEVHSYRETPSNVGASLLAKATGHAPIDSRGAPPVSTDAPLPEILILHSVRPAFSAAPVPLLEAPPTRPAPDVKAETVPDSNRGPLQIPFNKGLVSGQITITREPDEPTRTLLLSPSNTQVFDQLKTPFEQVRDPGWRLTDSGGEQHHQGSHQPPDEELDHEESSA